MPPKVQGLLIECIDDDRASTNQPSTGNASCERVFQEAAGDPAAGPGQVGRELPKQQTRHGAWRLARPDRSRHGRRNDSGRGKPAVAHDATVFMDHGDDGETVVLIRKCTVLQPIVERWFAAGKLRNIVLRAERFGT